ncbi:YlqD family protein [bacterium]|nr:YlqD family protein [bacterium]
MGVQVKRTVILRAIVTDELKQQVSDELQGAADEIEQRVQQLDFSTKAYITDLQRADLQRAMAVRKQIEAEKQKQNELRDALLERKAQVAVLQNGQEVIRGTLESYVEINEGDDLSVLLGGTEIVTKDGIVIEIRQRRPEEIVEAEETPLLVTPSHEPSREQ